MERIPNDSVNRVVFFVARDVTDLFTRETGLSSFTVDYVLDNGVRAQMTGPTTAEIDSTNMPGLYSLAVDEAGMTNMDAANDEEILELHITHASMTPVRKKVQVYRERIKAIDDLTKAGGNGDLAAMKVDLDAMATGGSAPSLE